MDNRKKKRRNRKLMNSYIVLAVVLCLCVIIMIVLLLIQGNSSSEEEQESSESSTSATAATELQSNEQVYDSVDDIVMDKDSGEATLNISNASDNSYSLKVTVELDTGEVLYESDMLEPGSSLGTVIFDTDITEGEYAVMISVDSYSSSEELVSGVIYNRTLVVE